MQNFVNKIAGLPYVLVLSLFIYVNPFDAFAQGGEDLCNDPNVEVGFDVFRGIYRLQYKTRDNHTFVITSHDPITAETRRNPRHAFRISNLEHVASRRWKANIGMIGFSVVTTNLFQHILRNTAATATGPSSWAPTQLISRYCDNYSIDSVYVPYLSLKRTWESQIELRMVLDTTIKVGFLNPFYRLEVRDNAANAPFEFLLRILSQTTDSQLIHFFSHRLQSTNDGVLLLELTQEVVEDLYLLSAADFSLEEPFFHSNYSLGSKNHNCCPNSSRKLQNGAFYVTRQSYNEKSLDLWTTQNGSHGIEIESVTYGHGYSLDSIAMYGMPFELLEEAMQTAKPIKIVRTHDGYDYTTLANAETVFINTITWTREYGFDDQRPVAFKIPIHSSFGVRNLAKELESYKVYGYSLEDILLALNKKDDASIREVLGLSRMDMHTRHTVTLTEEVLQKLVR